MKTCDRQGCGQMRSEPANLNIKLHDGCPAVVCSYHQESLTHEAPAQPRVKGQIIEERLDLPGVYFHHCSLPFEI